MPNYATIEAEQANLLEHPAVKAWAKLGPVRIEPRRVMILKPEKKRSAVYRLENVGPAGSPVIAKRGRAANMAIELAIYREVFPHLALRTLRCYGFVQDQDPGFGWLFLEDAGEERYSSGSEEHRALAAQWLGTLHTSAAAHAAAKACLPDHGLNYYRKVVWLACETIQPSLANPALSANDLVVLHAILSHCEVLASHWSEVEETCNVVPQTLVHGDFSAKNVRTRRGQSGLELFPLDWDNAGWGIAGADVSQTDVVAYWSVVRHHWPGLSLDDMRRFANVGRMFWGLEPVTGEAESLASDWVQNVMRKMVAYEAEFADALEATGWKRVYNKAHA